MKRKYRSHFHDPEPAKYARLRASFEAPARTLWFKWVLLSGALCVTLFFPLDCYLAGTTEIMGPLQHKYYVPPRIVEEEVLPESFWFEVDGKAGPVTKREFQARSIGERVRVTIYTGRFTGIPYRIGPFFVAHP